MSQHVKNKVGISKPAKDVEAYSVQLDVSAKGAPSVSTATAALSQSEIRNLVRGRLEAAKLRR